MTPLTDYVQAAVEAAVAAGADYADAYCSDILERSVEVEKSSINYCATVRDQGLSVRAFYRGGAGWASVQQLDLAAARECARRAVEMARATHPDPDFVALPDPTTAEEVPELFDDELAGLSSAEFVRWCTDGIEEARAVAPDVILQGGVGTVVGEAALASSTGVCVTSRGTSMDIGFMAIIVRDDDVGSYFEQDFARRVRDFQPTGVARTATVEALRQLGSRPAGTARMPIVLGPLATMSLVGSLVGAMSAESVQRNRSYLAGRAGTPIASEHLTIYEDPRVPAGMRSGAYDGEGVARVPMTLVDRGVLTDYLHNSYTANKAGVPNNAHATRGGYGGSVGIGASNLQIQPGARPAAELIAEVDEGLYIAYAGLSPNSVTGELSTTVDFGFKIERGELTYPLSTTLVGSDAFELLGGIDAVSSDYRQEPGIILPTIRIAAVQVAGAS